jgi:hypothetical protein
MRLSSLANDALTGCLSAFETDQTAPNSSTQSVLRSALEVAGVIFVEENGEGPGVRLRKQRPVDERIKPEDLNATNDD